MASIASSVLCPEVVCTPLESQALFQGDRKSFTPSEHSVLFNNQESHIFHCKEGSGRRKARKSPLIRIHFAFSFLRPANTDISTMEKMLFDYLLALRLPGQAVDFFFFF